MLLFSLANLGVGLSVWLGGPGLDSPRLDNVVSSLLLLACAIYIDHAARPVFAEPRWLRGGEPCCWRCSLRRWCSVIVS